LVAALLIMQAHDAAVVVNQEQSMSVSNFMKVLLPQSSFEALATSTSAR